jgi:hypothetical protein
MGNIVTVSRAALVRMCRGHAVTAVVENAARKECRRTLETQLSSRGAGRQSCLHRLKHSLIHNGLVLPAVGLAAVDHFPNVEAIVQEVSKGADSKGYPATGLTSAADFALGADASAVEVLQEGIDPSSRYRPKIKPTVLASSGTTTSFLLTLA